MSFALAHLSISRCRRPSLARAALAFCGVLALAGGGGSVAACGVASGSAKVEAVTERAEIRLDDGRLVRLAGLDIPTHGGFDAAAAARARLTHGWRGRTVAVALLATRPDRWGRWLADLALPDGPD